MIFSQKVKDKAESIRNLLSKDFPELLNKKSIVKNGTPESGFWYSGYYVALCDIIRLMDAELDDSISVDKSKIN